MTFVEQVDVLTAPHARLTPGLRELLTRIGLALAGRAGARLAAAVGVTVGRDTLIRLVRGLPDPAATAVTVLGADPGLDLRHRPVPPPLPRPTVLLLVTCQAA
ncbi:hypothetical protein NCC78_07385 [Micromonospora phytophila]|uniref:hypothetical protein n=1 Tax=Micromonospora phytophila TaxID=709888 RepID=UPI00202DBD8A|nr:hypothetical protein [Micromonospora phytophila]MCM0674509.1 hypothetical protein [Micromonospora phytophila]